MSKNRYHGLDGLRGVAAFVVTVCHTCQVVPALAFFGYFLEEPIRRGSGSWWATYSPLHILWAGTEAVYLFFVLSGFVLTLAMLGRRRWTGYYPKRLLRIYLPTWGAFLLVVFWTVAVPRDFSPTDSLWLRSNPSAIPADSIAGQLLLLPGGEMNGNGVLWTLRFEVIFSLLLPLVMLLGARLRRFTFVKVFLLLGAMLVFWETPFTLRFLLPTFCLGVLMAFERDRLAALADKIRSLRSGPLIWFGLNLAALLLLTARWSLLGMTSDIQLITYIQMSAGVFTTLGACLAIFLAAEGPWRNLLQSPAMKWLGQRSFSLYLVHYPIIVSVAILLGGSPSLWLALLVAVPASLFVAELFYQLVEHPSQRLAAAVGAKLDSFTLKRDLTLREPVPVPD